MSLPEIFKNTIDDNNKEEKLYRGKFTEVTDESIYDNLPVKVHIVTNTKNITTTIIGKTKNYIVTKERDVIYINDIKEITKL